jgi:iron-sulfur cluster repair protein YtfE (RIC family)
MALIKRGLGRGLETLLAGVSSLAGLQQEPVDSKKVDDQSTQTLIEHIELESHNLLKEAEALRSLIDKLESIIRADLR